MRYFIWRLNWADPNHGTGPEELASQDGACLEASMFANPDTVSGDILGYLTSGDIDVLAFAAWMLIEKSQEEALAFAQAINPAAYLLESGIITAPAGPTP